MTFIWIMLGTAGLSLLIFVVAVVYAASRVHDMHERETDRWS